VRASQPAASSRASCAWTSCTACGCGFQDGALLHHLAPQREDGGGRARDLLRDQVEAAAPFVDAAGELGRRHRQRIGEEGALQRGRDDVLLERSEDRVLRERALELAHAVAERDREQAPYPGAVQLASLLGGIEDLQRHCLSFPI